MLIGRVQPGRFLQRQKRGKVSQGLLQDHQKLIGVLVNNIFGEIEGHGVLADQPQVMASLKTLPYQFLRVFMVALLGGLVDHSLEVHGFLYDFGIMGDSLDIHRVPESKKNWKNKFWSKEERKVIRLTCNEVLVSTRQTGQK